MGVLFWSGAVELVFLLLFGIGLMDTLAEAYIFLQGLSYKCMGSNKPVHRIPHMGWFLYFSPFCTEG